MATKTWTLIDVKNDVYADTVTITPDDVEGAAEGYCVKKRRLRGGLRDGVDVVEVDNGAFRFVIIPTRGMGLWHARLDDIQLGWKAQAKGPVHPSLVPVFDPSGLGWLDGFDELLCRCGLESNGAPEFNDDGTLRYPLHGRIANLPAHKLEVTIDGESGEIQVSGTVDEKRLFFKRLSLTTVYTTKVGMPGVSIRDEVTNESAVAGDMELLYHINFGVPLLGPGAKACLPVKKVVPRDPVAVDNVGDWNVYGPEVADLGEAVFYTQLAADANGMTQATLKNATGDRGISLHVNTAQLPCFTLWKNRQEPIDGYVTGFEPGTNYPNAKSFEKEKGRVVDLAPGETRTFELMLEVHATRQDLEAAEAAVAKLQEGIAPEILDTTDPDFSQA